MSDNPFALTEREVRGAPVRVFAQNHACLSDLLGHYTTFADNELVVCDDVRLTYAEVARAAAHLATRLEAEHGVKAGDRVGIALPNSPAWIIAFTAVVSLGATPALMNGRASASELAHCLETAECRVWFGDASKVPAIGAAALDEAEVMTFADITASAELQQTPRQDDDEAIIMFTSGTTGRAKAAVLSHLSVMTSLKTIAYSGMIVASQMAEKYGIDLDTLLQMRPTPCTLLMFPLFHVSGCHAVFLSALGQGGKLVLMRRWDAERVLQLVEQEKITAFPGVPTMHWDVLGLPNRTDYDTSSLTSVSVGGQGTAPALLAAIHDAFPAAVLGTGYGMTECNGTITLTIGEEFIAEPSCAGKVVETMDVQIRDDDGNPLPTGEAGEIFVRGAALMSGYLGRPSPFDSDGWFATGDIGRLDADNRLSIVDRRTDMVISGGENVYCAEIERAIDLHPDVAESAAFGEPDSRLGERVVAVVVPAEGRAVDVDALTEHLNGELSRFKVPRSIRVSPQKLPRNPSGKIIKPEARALYQALENQA